MTDQHAHAGYVGHDGYLNGGSGPGGDGPHAHSTGSFDVDPLFGAMRGGPGAPSAPSGRAPDGTGQFDTGAFASPYDTTGTWTVPAQATAYGHGGAPHHDPLGTGTFPAAAFDTAAFDTGTFTTGTFAAPTGTCDTGQFDTGQYDTGRFDTTGQWDAHAWAPAQDTGQYATTALPCAYDTTGQWAVPGAHADTGTYDATAWNATTGATAWNATVGTTTTTTLADAGDQLPHETAQFPQVELAEVSGPGSCDAPGESDAAGESDAGASPSGMEVPASRAEARRAGNRRRRTPAKRSALLTVAVPSVCVMGVAGVAVASVDGLGGGKDGGGAVLAASDPASVKPVAANKNLDTQLAHLSAGANSFADRASRTQERIDLKARQDAEKKKKEEAAAAKEAARPKFVLPVTQKGLSAYYGQAGVNWMSVHTGIDFPVSFGTPVMSAIDGTVRTQWNSAYGNMAIVTGADGTETWYCHLSSTKIRSGPVKAGDVIAYSGSSGNSTGPHLHFEVRPDGGSSIDPLPWLRGHGLDPT